MKLKTFVRLGTGLVVAVATSVALHAMGEHGASVFSGGGSVFCHAYIHPPDPSGEMSNVRSVKMWLRGPNQELLVFHAYGAFDFWEYDYEDISEVIHHASVGPGTYSCHVEFREEREYWNTGFETDTDEWTDTVEIGS